MFCSKCGKEVNDEAVVCTNCGCAISKGGKSKIAAGLLAIFLGTLGIHNFYLGRTGRAILQLALTISLWILSFIMIFVTSILAHDGGGSISGAILGLFIILLIGIGIWVFIEGILCLTGKYKDAQGRDLI